MVGGCFPEGDDCKHVLSRFHCILGGKIWRACISHFGQGHAVLINNMQQLCSRLGIRHIMTTSYHPQANGMVERVHSQLKDSLCAREAGAEHLLWVLLGLRAAPKETTGISSAQLVLGQPLVLPGELKDVSEAPAEDFFSQLTFVDPPPTCQLRSYAAVAASNIMVSKQLQEAIFVFMQRGGTIPPLVPVYSGPYTACCTQAPRCSPWK